MQAPAIDCAEGWTGIAHAHQHRCEFPKRVRCSMATNAAGYAMPRSGFGLKKLQGRVSGLIRLPGKLLRPGWQDDAREHAGRPDVGGVAKVGGIVQGAALDAQRVSRASTLVPDP